MSRGRITLPTSPSGVFFPSLIELSLTGSAVDDGFLRRFPTTTTIPSLRALALVELERAPNPDLPLPLYLPLTLLRQLDLLTIDSQDRYLDVYANGVPPACLFLDGDPEAPDHLLTAPTLPSFVRLHPFKGILDLELLDAPLQSICAAFVALTNHSRRSTPSTPFSVVLPLYLGSLEEADELNELCSVVSAQGGEVIREQEVNFSWESSVPPEVWRRLSRRKQEKEARPSRAGGRCISIALQEPFPPHLSMPRSR